VNGRLNRPIGIAAATVRDAFTSPLHIPAFEFSGIIRSARESAATKTVRRSSGQSDRLMREVDRIGEGSTAVHPSRKTED
jgi:hypothetical protein